MATNPDIMLLVRLLDEEGFSALAGELLTEISLGRELDLDDVEGTDVEKPAASTDGIAVEANLRREAFEVDEQLGVAVSFLRLRLVQPVRYLAEAERIAAELRTDTPRGTAPVVRQVSPSEAAIRITFVDPDSSTSSGLMRIEEAGGNESADRLDAVLTLIAEQAI